MNLRCAILGAALTAIIAAGFHHWKVIRTQSRFEVEHARLVKSAAETRRLSNETSQQIAIARNKLEAADAKKRERIHPARSTALAAARPGANAMAPARSAGVPPDPELRRLQVQAYVSEQRLRFGELLNRLHFTVENRQAFDRIHAAYQQAILDSPTESAREQVRLAREIQLQELFGVNYEQWLNAHRNQPARAIVAQIVQQTFQSAGALTTAQADELTRIVAQHRLPASKQTEATQSHDWDRIISDAQSLLADGQREAFITAIEFRRASEGMSAIAARSKR